MSKGKLFAWLTAIVIGLWMGFSAIQTLDAVAAKAEQVRNLPVESRR